MKNILTSILIFSLIPCFGQNPNYQRWLEFAKEDITLQPEYGGIEKTNKQLESDEMFKKDILEQFNGDTISASSKMTDLGFTYLYDKGDFITAMKRFNQAFLLNPKNPDIYYGYGSVYFNLGAMEQAREQYEKGLKIAPRHSDMIIDYGTTYLGDFYNEQTNPEMANKYLDKAIEKLSMAYQINPKNSNSGLKLSICYMLKEDCDKANEYLKIAERSGNPNITEQFKNELEETCRAKDLDCSNFKTGKFKHLSEEYGETIIERTNEYQIEESTMHGDKLKLKITWMDDCTYQLQPIADLSNPENNEVPTMILTSTITEITENGYIQISSSDVSPVKIKSELIRIEE